MSFIFILINVKHGVNYGHQNSQKITIVPILGCIETNPQEIHLTEVQDLNYVHGLLIHIRH